MRRNIEFDAEGVTLRGWLYMPERTPAPTVVMAHGFSAVKEMYLDDYADVFSASGLGVLVYDNRCLGASGGEPRQEIDPWLQVRDYRHAITFVATLEEVDVTRIGVWGSSYSGAHVLVVAAIDRRVKCVVSQVPLISGYRNMLRSVRADHIAEIRAQFDQDREARYAGGTPAMMRIVAEDPAAPCMLPHRDSYEWFTNCARTRAPTWRNEITLRSVEMASEYEAGAYIYRISPTPLLMVIAARDHAAVADLAFAGYERALQPKALQILPGGHFDAYVKDFELSSSAARDWFVKYLQPEQVD